MSPLPPGDPFRDPVEHVLGVRCDLDLALFFERKQTLNRRHQLRQVVGGARIVAEELLLDSTEQKQTGPSPWPGIADTSPSVIKEIFFMPRNGDAGAPSAV